MPESPTALAAALRSTGYLADDGLATATYLALRMGRPLFCEGEPGTGKTALAQALAEVLGAELIRLQCHDGIDASQALYDWDFPRQLLHLRALEAAAASDRLDVDAVEASLYDPKFLLARPILRALQTTPAVLLVDEIDRADDEFEAFLLEVLTEHAVTIPEIGEVRAKEPPLVVLTSNRTREVHDALKRRCLYLWLDHPDVAREIEILHARLPGLPERLAAQVAAAVRKLREADLLKPPGVAETLDWARALQLVGATAARRRQRGRHARRRPQVPRGRRPRPRPARRAHGFVTIPVTESPGPITALVGFTAVLRGAGVPVTTDRVAAFLAALDELDVTSRWQTYWAGRLTLCADPDDLHRYDQAFEEWFAERRSGGTKVTDERKPPPPKLASLDPSAPGRTARTATSDATTIRAAPRAARCCATTTSPTFADAEREHLRSCSRCCGPTRRPARRGAGAPARHGAADPRRTLRAALRNGGEVRALLRRDQSRRPRKIVLLVDVSGSMEPYADALLRFAHVVTRRSPASVETFTLGTRLTRVTRELRMRDADHALHAAGKAIPDWSGGTRLGEVLRAFVDRWGQRARPGARSSSSSPTAGSAASPCCSASRWPGCGGWRTGSSG